MSLGGEQRLRNVRSAEIQFKGNTMKDTAIITKIKCQMIYQDMTQAELAKKIKSHKNTINNFLSGRRQISLDKLLKIFKVLGLKITIKQG